MARRRRPNAHAGARGLLAHGAAPRHETCRLDFALLVVLIVYYAYGVFEGRAVNAGNFLSYLFFFAWGYGICLFNDARSAARPHASADAP